MISDKTKGELMRCGGLRNKTFITLCTTVAEDHDKLKVLFSVLQQCNESRSLAQKMLCDYGKPICLFVSLKKIGYRISQRKTD